MGRGKPFKQPLQRLVSAGVVPRPTWFSSVQATRPPFVPVKATRPTAIEYPEDRLRTEYLRRNPSARHVPVDLKAPSLAERHISDRFVQIQMRLMEQGLAEEEAYNRAEQEIGAVGASDDSYGPLDSAAVADEDARLYIASLKDSQRDQKLFRALVKQAKEIA